MEPLPPVADRGFAIRVHRGAGFLVLGLSGELDLASAPALHARIGEAVEAGHVRLVLDLSRLRLCDASGLTVMVRWARLCGEHGGWLRLSGAAGMVRRVFAVVAFGSTVPVYATVAGACLGDENQRVKD